MYTQVEKPKENKSRAVANSVAQKKSNVKQGFGFVVDNRPEKIAQRKLLQGLTNKSQTVIKSHSIHSIDHDKKSTTNGVIQGYFTHKGQKLDEKTAESVHGWAHANLVNKELKQNFFQICSDTSTPTSIENWFQQKSIELNDNVFKHLSHYAMGELELRKNELIFQIQNMYQDAGQSADDISGIKKLCIDISNVDISKSTAYAFLQGYDFQVKTLISYANQSKYVEKDGVDVFKPKVKTVEASYQDHEGTYRYADMEINNSDDEETSYIEVKAMATSYDPDEQTKLKFQNQAKAYAQSGKSVMYVFKNQPPNWVEIVLQQNKLNYKVVPE